VITTLDAATELRHMADTLDVYAEAANTRASGGSSSAYARWAGKVDGYKVAARMLREQAGRLDMDWKGLRDDPRSYMRCGQGELYPRRCSQCGH
jgi:hypothetical protein